MAYRRENTDWRCSSCTFSNFRRRSTCKSCGAARGGGGGARGARGERRPHDRGGPVANASGNAKPGDWICAACNENNFRNRTKCYKCRAAKPAAIGTEAREAEGQNRRGRGDRDRGNRRGRNDRNEREGERADPVQMDVDEKDQDLSRVEIAAGTFATLAAGGVVESIELNTESIDQSVRIEWNTGPSTGKANALFRQNGSALMAVEALKRTRIGRGFIRAEDPAPFEHKGESIFKVHLQGVPLDYDDEMLTRAIDGLGVEDFVEAFVFRREPAVTAHADIVATTIKSLFDRFGMIRLKSHPPRFGTAAAILDFPDTVSCLAAIGELNNTPCGFGVGKLKVKLDLRCVIATQQEVWDLLQRNIEELMFTIRRDRAQFPSVKIFLFGRNRSVTGSSRAVVCGSDPAAVCKARELYNDLLRPLVLYLDHDAVVYLVSARLNEHIVANEIRRVWVRSFPSTGIIRVFAAPDVRQGLNEFCQGILGSMLSDSVRASPRAVRMLLGHDEFVNLNTGNNRFEAFVSANLPESSMEVVCLDAEKMTSFVAYLQETFVAAGAEDVEAKDGDDDGHLCGVCFMDIEPGETSTTLTSCTHSFHSECLAHQTKFSLGVTGTRPLTCAQCQVPIELEAISKFLTREQMTDLSKLCARDFLRTHPADFKQCPTPDCNQIYPANGTGLFNCSECLRQYCMTCRAADGTLANFHAGMTCEGFQASMNADESFAEFMKTYSAESTSKECPYCHTLTDKFTNTCNHATCVYCKTHFCWKCLWISPEDRFRGHLVYAHMTSAHGGWYAR